MSIFSGVGDFFRGAFGEDAEEKKRRKQREAQEAAQRKAAQQQPKPQQFPTKNIQDLFGKQPPKQPKPKPEPVKPPPPKDDFLQDAADIASLPGRSILRVATGVGQGVSGLYDLFSPGKGTNRVSQALDKAAKFQDESAEQAGVGTAYKVLNVPTEIASFFIPSTLAIKVASQFPKGTKLTAKVVESIARNVDDAGQANKVRRFLADRMRRGWTVDQAIEETIQSAKYTGQNASQGKDTSPASVATDVATSVGGSLLFPNRLRRAKTTGAEAVEDVVGVATAATGEVAENQLTRNVDEVIESVEKKGVRNATDEELEAIAKDIDRPAIDRKPAADEIKRRATAPTPEKPAYQHKQDIANIVKRETDNFNRMVANNPKLTRAQLEAAQKAAQARALKLINDLQASRDATVTAVGDQAEDIAGAASKQAATNAEVAAEQAAKTSPPPGQVVETPPAAGSPEVAANDAYRTPTEEILFPNQPPIKERDNLALSQRFSPDRIWRENIAQPALAKLDQGINALQTGKSRIGRGIGRLFTGFFREAGVSPVQQTAKMKLRGGVETGKVYRETIADLAKNHDDNSLTRIWATLDPEHAARAGFNPNEIQLDGAETVLRDKLKAVIDNTTAENLRRGLITPEQAASESYLKRAYTVFDGNTEAGKFEHGFRQELLGQFKGRKQVSDEMVDEAIKDPTYLVGKKTAESNAIWAMQDYGTHLKTTGVASDVAKPGYVQLPDSPVFGDAAAKFVPQNVAEDFTGFQYSHAMTNAFNDLVTAYDRLGIRQAKKQLLTIFNPAVRLGNQMTNRVVFSQLAGINPLQFNVTMARAKREIATRSPIYREAVAQGLTGIDISQADFYAKRIANSAGQDKNIYKKAIEWAQTSYSGADDQARVAAYMIQRGRGYPPEEAARLIQHGFQDYKSVGFFYDLAAKTPFIGNAFVRFAADSARIAKNAVVDHPLRTLSTLAAWSAFTNGMSVLSGESYAGEEGDSTAKKALNLVTGSNKSDAQKAREGRFGSPKIPFTNIAIAVQTPWGEVNAARFMPWYQLNEIQNTAASKFLPLQQSPIKIEDGKIAANAPGFQDPLLGQLVQLGIDRDFRNKSIQDPGNEEGKYTLDPLTGEEKRNNVLRFLFDNNAPLGRETDNLFSAYKKEPIGDVIGSHEGKDLYGKERNPLQAWLRAGGLKIEQYGDEQVKEQADTNRYFREKEEIDKEVEGMEPSAQEAYKRLTGYYKLRERVPNEFTPGETRDKKAEVYNFSEDKWKDLAAHPELYKLLVAKKQRESQPRDGKPGKPIQPEFDERLSESFRKQLLQNKMVAPGDDAELDQRMYSSPEFDYYSELKKEYKALAAKYYPKNDNFDDETVRHEDAEFPKKPDILKQYGAQYGLYADGKGAKPEFTDAIKGAKEAYNKLTFNWTNTERKARGLPAIVWDMWNNPTFGYDETPSGMGFGFGGGGSSYNPADHVNTLGELTNFSGGIDRLDPIEAAAMPQLAQLFARLRAGSGGGRRKPPIGASASGR